MPLLYSEAKCEVIDIKMIFYSHANKIRFHNQGFAFWPGFESDTFWNSEMLLITYFTLRFARPRFSRYFQLHGPRGRDPFAQQRESERKGPLETRLMS